jgi:hypothetical protein
MYRKDDEVIFCPPLHNIKSGSVTVTGDSSSLDIVFNNPIFKSVPSITVGTTFGNINLLNQSVNGFSVINTDPTANGILWDKPIIVEHQTNITINVGAYSSLLVVNGKPAISYVDTTDGYLKYVRSIDVNGLLWNTHKIIDNSQQIYIVEERTCMIIVSGNPAVAYYDSVSNNLKYVRAIDNNGSLWYSPITIDILGKIPKFVSMKIVNEFPAICLQGTNLNITNDILYVRSLNAIGSIWGLTKTVISNVGVDGTYPRLEIVHGFPAIGGCNYQKNVITSGFFYITATDINGSTWGDISEIITPPNEKFISFSLKIVNGFPAFCACSLNNFLLIYLRSNDITGSSWPLYSSKVIIASSSLYFNNMIEIVNNNPAIISNKLFTSELIYIQSLDNEGINWPNPLILSNNVNVNGSISIVNGTPAISYCMGNGDLTNNNKLKYIRAIDINGTLFGAPVTVDSQADLPGNLGLYTSLELVSGSPAISYYDSAGKNLKYIRSNNINGSTWSGAIIIDNYGDIGKYSSLKIINNRPSISYYDQTNGNLKFIRANDIVGSSWQSPLILDSIGDVGLYTSMNVINSFPAISYYDLTNGKLKYIYCTDTDGLLWSSPLTVDFSTNVGEFTSLSIVNNFPAISYYDITNGNLKYIRANDLIGSSWGTPIIVDNVNNVGKYSCLLVTNGFPSIVYYDQTNSNLKYIRATNSNGSSWSSPIIIDSLVNVGEYI